MAELSDELLAIIEHEIRDVWLRAEGLKPDDLQSRAYDLLHKIHAQVQPKPADQIIWLIYYDQRPANMVLDHISSTEDKADQWISKQRYPSDFLAKPCVMDAEIQ